MSTETNQTPSDGNSSTTDTAAATQSAAAEVPDDVDRAGDNTPTKPGSEASKASSGLADHSKHPPSERAEGWRSPFPAMRNRNEFPMSTLQEIKSAIGGLNADEKALLAAQLFAMNAEPDEAKLKASLDRGLADVQAGRGRPIEEVKSMIPPMEFKVLIAETAIADLKEIVEFVAHDDQDAGARVGEKLI